MKQPPCPFSGADLGTAGVLPSHGADSLTQRGCSVQPSIKNSAWIRGPDTVKRQTSEHYYCKEKGCNEEHIIGKSLVWEMKHFRWESPELYTASLNIGMSPFCSIIWVFQYSISKESANWGICRLPSFLEAKKKIIIILQLLLIMLILREESFGSKHGIMSIPCKSCIIIYVITDVSWLMMGLCPNKPSVNW